MIRVNERHDGPDGINKYWMAAVSLKTFSLISGTNTSYKKYHNEIKVNSEHVGEEDWT